MKIQEIISYLKIFKYCEYISQELVSPNAAQMHPFGIYFGFKNIDVEGFF